MYVGSKQHDHIPFEVIHHYDEDIREQLMVSEPFMAMNPVQHNKPTSFSINTRNLSVSHFPMVTKVIPTGSRPERLYTHESDVDYIIECGPITVKPRGREGQCLRNPRPNYNGFYCEPTCHDGFYNVLDKDGFDIHPAVLQIQLAPYLMNQVNETSILQKMMQQTKGKAALPEGLFGTNEDFVIALRLSNWPSIVRREIRKQLNPEMLEAVWGMFLCLY